MEACGEHRNDYIRLFNKLPPRILIVQFYPHSPRIASISEFGNGKVDIQIRY